MNKVRYKKFGLKRIYDPIATLIHYLQYAQREGRKVISVSTSTSVIQNIDDDSIEIEVNAIQSSGLFEQSFYLGMYPDLQLQSQDAIRHYCTSGWREGRDPSDTFSTKFYLNTNEDIRAADINPFYHYVTHGLREGRKAIQCEMVSYHDDIWFGKIQTDIKLVAFYISPDLSLLRGASPMFLGHVQPLIPLETLRYSDSINPIVLRQQVKIAKCHGIYGFCFELGVDNKISLKQPIDIILEHADIDIQFCVQVVLDSKPAIKSAVNALKAIVSDRRQIKIEERPIILVNIHGRKNHVIDLLKSFRRQLSDCNIVQPFLLIRRTYDEQKNTDISFMDLCDGELDLSINSIENEIEDFIPMNKNSVSVVPYERVSSYRVACIQEEREIARRMFHMVTVGRDNTYSASLNPMVYSKFTTVDYRRWLDAAIESTRLHHNADRRFIFLNAWNSWNEGSFIEPEQQMGFLRLNETSRALFGHPSGKKMPKISVVVPNYNHERFLHCRLDSIYNQTYKNIEVFLLDDCSSDNSRQILNEYAAAFPEITTTLYNSKNSGSVFQQWAKGIKAATGELVWIAESDDFCDKYFLEVLVSCFDDQAVLLAYGQSVFVDQNESVLEGEFQRYVSDLMDPERWSSHYTETAHNEVKRALGIKNTIPNASGVIFRKPIDMPLLNNEQWLSMSVAGDWIFYLHLLRGGKISYRNDAINFFRRYPGSQAETTYKKEVFYREVGFASFTVASLYDVPLDVLERSYEGYKDFYWKIVGQDGCEFDKWYDYDSILSARQSRLPNIMVAMMSFYPGGAEIFPIRLANEFRRQGHSVLILSAGLFGYNDKIRRMLHNDVPVIETANVRLTKDLIDDFGIEVLNTHFWHVQKYPLCMPEVFDRLYGHIASLHGMIENSDFGVTEEELRAVDQKVTTWVYTAEKNIVPFTMLGLRQGQSSRFVKIPNGRQPLTVIPFDRAQMNIPDNAFVLCCVSRAIAEKGWEEMIRVVERARNLSNIDIRLILVGDGPVYDTKYCHMNPHDFVYFTGFREDAVRIYAAADMGIMLTKFKSESFPLTIIDCLFAGKPYIGSDIGDIRNMLTSEEGEIAGAVVPLENWEIPIEYAACLVATFASDREEYTKAVRVVNSIVCRYSIDAVASQYIQLFDASRHNARLGMQTELA